MKTQMIYVKWFAGILIAAFSLYLTTPATALKPNKQEAESRALPDNINKIIQKSCFGCHSSEGNSMAKSHVNFTQWEGYAVEKQASKAKSIAKMVTKGSMPPKGFKKSHPDAIPSQAEVEEISKWADALNKK
jgi:hypothetical protein